MPDAHTRNFEDRLDAMRQEAKHGITGRGVDVSGGPIPRRAGYYGEAVGVYSFRCVRYAVAVIVFKHAASFDHHRGVRGLCVCADVGERHRYAVLH